MDSINDYLEILEEMIETSKSAPFSNKISVDKEKILELIEEIRLNMPQEFKNAQRIIAEHDKIINDAKTKSQNIIKDAENSAKILTSSHEIYKLATEEANNILEEAKKSSRDMRLNARDYADEILAKTEDIIKETLVNLNNQHNLMEDYMLRTTDILYSNRNQLRGNNARN